MLIREPGDGDKAAVAPRQVSFASASPAGPAALPMPALWNFGTLWNKGTSRPLEALGSCRKPPLPHLAMNKLLSTPAPTSCASDALLDSVQCHCQSPFSSSSPIPSFCLGSSKRYLWGSYHARLGWNLRVAPAEYFELDLQPCLVIFSIKVKLHPELLPCSPELSQSSGVQEFVV